MKKTVALMFIAMAAASAQASPSAKESVLALAASIAWYGQDDLRIPIGGKIVWIDPVYGKSAEKADIILVTHSHPDHYSPARIKELSGPDTLVLAGFDGSPYQRIKPGDSRTEKGIRIRAVPAYNASSSNHPKSASLCGFILGEGDMSVYVAGDTSRIPEMKDIDCGIAFLPLGQRYTMASVEEAELAALDVKAEVAIPIHWGMFEGSEADADKFVADLGAKGVKALKLPRSK